MRQASEYESIRVAIQDILKDELGIERSIEESTSLRGELGLDSVDAMVFAVEVERRFSVDLCAARGELNSVGDLISVVQRLLHGVEAPAPALALAVQP